MTVYIEYVLIDNMVFDCLILWAASMTMKMRLKFWRVLAGGVVGTVCAVVSVYTDAVLDILLKAACLFFMCVCCCGFRKKLIWHILLTVAYTFVMGGAIVGLFFLFEIEFSLSTSISYNNSVPLGIYILGTALSVFLIYSTAIFVKARQKIDVFTVDVKVRLSNEFHAVGFFDSGNTLEYEETPVCFATGMFKKRIADEIAMAVLKGTTRKISYLTMAGEATAIAIPCKITFKEKTVDILLAVSKLKTAVNYDILLHQSFLEEEKNETEKIVSEAA